MGDITTKLLYAQWSVFGDEAEAAGMENQYGGYAEISWRPLSKLGLFAKHSAYSQEDDQSATQSDIGANFYVHENVVFKADVQVQNQDAGDATGFNLGMGYQF